MKILSHHAMLFPLFLSAFVYVLLFQVFVALAEPDLARPKCCFCHLHGLRHGGSSLVSEQQRNCSVLESRFKVQKIFYICVCTCYSMVQVLYG